MPDPTEVVANRTCEPLDILDGAVTHISSVLLGVFIHLTLDAVECVTVLFLLTPLDNTSNVAVDNGKS